jgi:hypothetical protein
MLAHIEMVLFLLSYKRLCKLAHMSTIQEILQDLRSLLDVSDKQIERADSELFVEVQRLLYVRLSSDETDFVSQLAGAFPDHIEHAILSEELKRIQLALPICYI